MKGSLYVKPVEIAVVNNFNMDSVIRNGVVKGYDYSKSAILAGDSGARWHPGQWDLLLSRSCSIETVDVKLNDTPILSISKPRISVGVNCTIGMDWARDNIGLSERDLANVFKYEPKHTTIVRMLMSSKVPFPA